MNKSAFSQVSDIDAEVAQAQSLLQDARTCVDANLYEGGFGDMSVVVQYHAGNIQVLLGVIGAKLNSAIEKLAELNDMLHTAEKETTHE